MNTYEKRMNEEWEKYQNDKKNENYPTIMLLGIISAGKSSLINRVFRKEIANISKIEPETRGYTNIYYGKDYGSTVNLVDTAGYRLGKSDTYCKDIRETISKGVKGQLVHIIWYCIPVVNTRIQDIDEEVLRMLYEMPTVRKRVCVVFTKCDLDADGRIVAFLRKELRCRLDFYIECFETSNIEGMELDVPKLIQWSADAIDDEDLRRKFLSAQMTDLEIKNQEAGKVIMAAVAGAALVGAAPVPFSDAALLVPVQTMMLSKIIDIYGISSLASFSKGVISDLFITTLGRNMASNLLKMIPGVGQLAGGVINAGVASSLTGAVGYAASEVCYQNVKNYLDGKPVSWEIIFESEEFFELVKTFFKQAVGRKK